MKTVDLNQLITNVQGEPFDGATTLGKVIGGAFSNIGEKVVDPIKVYELTNRLFNEATIELDSSDLSLVKDLVQKSPLPTYVVGQILSKLEG